MNIDLSRSNPDFIYETNYWVVLLAWKLVYPRFLIVAKPDNQDNYYQQSSLLPIEAVVDYHKNIVQVLEYVLTQLFASGKSDDIVFNYFRLMNEGYQSNPPAPFVHEHLRLRIRHPLQITSFEFEDPSFGHFPPREKEKQGHKIDGTPEERAELINVLRISLFSHYPHLANPE